MFIDDLKEFQKAKSGSLKKYPSNVSLKNEVSIKNEDIIKEEPVVKTELKEIKIEPLVKEEPNVKIESLIKEEPNVKIERIKLEIKTEALNLATEVDSKIDMESKKHRLKRPNTKMVQSPNLKAKPKKNKRL